MRKTKRLLGCILLFMLFAVGCGNQSSQNNYNKKVYLTLNEMDAFRQTLVDAAIDKAAQEGITLEVSDAGNSIEKQVQLIKGAAEQKYDVILCGAVSIDTIVELKASAGDVPIIFLNSCPSKKQLTSGKYVYVGSDEQMAGQYQAEYILEKFASRDELNVVILKGPKGHSATNGRTNGVKRTLRESGKKINYVFEDYADWDTEKAKKLFQVFLKTGAPVDCVICNNDGMALGVVEACKEAGIDMGSLPILGVDATAEGCEAIKNGEMAFTVYQSGLGQGQKAIEMAISFAKQENGKNVEGISEDGRYVWVPFEKVDSSNVSKYAK